MTRRSSTRRGPRADRAPEDGGGAVVLEGELTIRTAGDRKAELLSLLGGVDRLRLDLSAISEIDTAGLQLLLLARRETVAQGAGFEITATSRAVDEALAIVHLGRALDSTTPDPQEAHR